MTALGELFGLGTPAEQDRIRHDRDVIRRHGLAALRHQIDGHPVPADLYIAAIAQLEYRHSPRGRRRAAEEAAVDHDYETRPGVSR